MTVFFSLLYFIDNCLLFLVAVVIIGSYYVIYKFQTNVLLKILKLQSGMDIRVKICA